MGRQFVVFCVAVCVALGSTGTSVAAGSPGHPWPTGDEWPRGLEGPFDVPAAERLHIPSFDGTRLAGWLWKPDLPEGVRAPVVLWSGPYHAGLDSAGSDGDGVPGGRDRPVLVERLVSEGFAVAVMNVRGTGESGGCVDFFGRDEQRDQAVLVEWLAGRLEKGKKPSDAAAWSNGRVGMVGLSYDGTTPWEAAIQDPPGLKAIVAMSGVGDFFLNYATPQGSMYPGSGAPAAANFAANSAHPPLHREPHRGPLNQPTALGAWAGVAPERVCDDVVRQNVTSLRDPVVDDRDRAFYDDRRLTDDFHRIRAATLFTAGFGDGTVLNHSIDAYGWSLLDAPKALVLGPWQHHPPDFGAWPDRVSAWLAFWLKGVGTPPALGTVEWHPAGEDPCAQWPCRTTQSWPPGRSEVLHLADGAMTPGAQAAAPAELRAAPRPGLDAVPCASAATAAAFVTAPLEAAVTVAGSPFALLALRADEPGGIVAARLYDLAPGVACDGHGSPAPAELIAAGAADLRFHAGTFRGRDFSVDATSPVRIDLANAARTVPEGHRLALVVSGPVTSDVVTPNAVSPYAPAVEVLADGTKRSSQVVLPLASGTLGGAAPTIHYPRRPFVPGG